MKSEEKKWMEEISEWIRKEYASPEFLLLLEKYAKLGIIQEQINQYEDDWK